MFVVSTSIKKRLGASDDSTVSSSTDHSASAVNISSKLATSISQRNQLSRRKPNQTVTVKLGGAAGVFSRLGSR